MRKFAWAAVAAVALLASPGPVAVLWAQELSKLKPKDIPRLMAEADKFIAANDLPHAQAYLQAVIGLDPTQSQAAFKLAGVCEKQKDWDCTMVNYQLALAALGGAEKARAHLALATGHLRAQRHGDAAEHAGAALAIDPALTSAHVIRAESLVKTQSPDAIAACEAATKAAPDSAVAHASLGEALMAANRGADAEAPLRRALELDPRLPATSARLAELLSAKGDHEGTIAAASQALAADASRRDLYALRGKAYLAQHDDAKALEDLYAAAAAAPHDKALVLALGQVQHRQGRLDAAAQQYRSVLAIDPQQHEAQLGLADVLVRTNDFEQARDPASKAAAALPDAALAHYLHGRVLEHDKQYDEAIAAYTRATVADAGRADAHHGLGRILREHRKDIPNALASMEKAAALDASNPAVLTDLGASLYEAKQVDRAVETLQKAVATPEYANPMGYAVLGLALKDKKDYATSITHLERAAELAPKWWMPRWGAAWSYFGQFKKGCPCGPDDQARVQKMQAHFDEMTALGGKDPGLAERVKMLVSGLKIK